MHIVINNLSKPFRGGIHALSDVSIDIGSGMVGLLGSNGAGKTTLMRILCGVLPPSSGRALLDNGDMNDRSVQRHLKRRLGYRRPRCRRYGRCQGHSSNSSKRRPRRRAWLRLYVADVNQRGIAAEH